MLVSRKLGHLCSVLALAGVLTTWYKGLGLKGVNLDVKTKAASHDSLAPSLGRKLVADSSLHWVCSAILKHRTINN